ncbi:MAG: hypothetical protein PHT36_01605 [Patescibacteria group bacterium]|nr:hypothetical protein [Patescibacteria group bacterium]
MTMVKLFWEENVPEIAIQSVRVALSECHQEIFSEGIEIQALGWWKDENSYHPEGHLHPHRSIEWYFQNSYSQERRQLESETPLTFLDWAPEKRESPHLTVVVLTRDLYRDGYSFLFSDSGRSSIFLSTFRTKTLQENALQELTKSFVAHEYGRIIGLDGNPLKEGCYQSKDRHEKYCAMAINDRSSPKDWIRVTKERMALGRYYCPICKKLTEP